MNLALRPRALAAPLAAVVLLSFAATSAAAPPANDDRADARTVAVPSETKGTTVGSTLEQNEPAAGCSNSKGSVWYRFQTNSAGRIAVRLNADGDLDGSVQLFKVVRSQAQSIDCDDTNNSGDAAVSFTSEANATYLVRVGQRFNSVAGTFTLSLVPTQSEAQPPGRRLPARGVSSTVDRLFNPSDAYSVRLRAGVTYRFNERSGDCVGIELFGPFTTAFDEPSVRNLGCGGYFLYTPKADEGGPYSIRISANTRTLGALRYRLQVGRALSDDTTPGRFIRNYASVRGTLTGARLDVVDLYRFDVTRTSVLDLTVKNSDNFDVRVLDDRGRFFAFGDNVNRRLRPGRYYIAVQANQGQSGKYTLRRISRTITRTRLTIDNVFRRQIGPGRLVTLRAHVSPGATGPVEITVERFDPLEGYQFLRRYSVRAVRGNASVSFRPPTQGRYRASAVYEGSRGFATSATRSFAQLLVAAPLTQ